MKSQMGRLECATPRLAWGGEATDFTPLLAQPELLSYLGRACELGELHLVEVEHATAGNRSLDILAELADGRRVVIENQYGTADHDHLTRGLAYAVAVDAAALVLVAEDHRDEFVAVADYLNRLAGDTPDGITVWLVQVRAVRRQGDDIWSPEFVVMAQPNQWEAAQRARAAGRLQSLLDFYRLASDAVGEQYAADARAVVDHWIAQPRGEEGHSSTGTVALYVPSATGADRSCALQLHTDGTVTVCRGYVRDGCPPFQTDEGAAELDRRIRELFPGAAWTGKQYSLRVAELDPDAAARWADWILDVTTGHDEVAGTTPSP